MEQDLQARRVQAENSFNELVKLKDEVELKLKTLGVASFAEIDTELARLQGEARLVDDLFKAKPPVSPTAEVIDATAVDKGEAKKAKK